MQIGELERCIDLEIVKTEKKRLEIFLAFTLFGIVLLFINILFFPVTISEVFIDNRSINFGILVSFVLSIFLLMSRFMVGKIASCEKPLPSAYKIYSVLIESGIPFVWLIVLITWEENAQFLNSPLIFLYIPIIVVSSLHLSFILSVFNGLIIGVVYAGITFWTFENYDTSALLPNIVFYTKSIMFVLSGVIAGMVAEELKKRLKISVETQDEKDSIEALFSQQVSKEVVQALKSTNGESSKIEATVLFLDIRDFTNRVQHLSPERVNEFQNKFFEPLMDCIHKNNGVINQIMGDGLMATFATATDGNYEGAYNATVEIFNRIGAMNESTQNQINIGVGIHSGEIIAGNIGNEIRQQFSMSGIPVIVAARLEQMTKDYDCSLIVSSTFYEKVKHLTGGGTSLGLVKMKGIDAEMEIIKLR
ncbi:MAG: adenylate/guanylate cyclase domain-containing protein [Ekhidna sp.]